MSTITTTDFRPGAYFAAGAVQFNRAEVEEAIGTAIEDLDRSRAEAIIITLVGCRFPFEVLEGETLEDAIARVYFNELKTLLHSLVTLAISSAAWD
jgi:hypothetical protein